MKSGEWGVCSTASSERQALLMGHVVRDGAAAVGSSRSGTAGPARLSSRAPRVPHSRSILNVSSVAGSVRTMSGSFSMWSPSKVKGSILSSSRGNWESASKLTSPTPAKELVSSFDKLGGDSPVTAGKRKRKVSVGLANTRSPGKRVIKQLAKTEH